MQIGENLHVQTCSHHFVILSSITIDMLYDEARASHNSDHVIIILLDLGKVIIAHVSDLFNLGHVITAKPS